MSTGISLIDWLVIAFYLLLLIGFAIYLSLSQRNREDYYVAGRNMGSWPIAISVMATQCSTNSILGAPAFVAFTVGGGLVWLQYELALPLAMIALMLFFIPVFRSLRLLSVYEYLEIRFGKSTRLLLAALFLFVRAFATAVTVYGIAIVIELITGLSFVASVIILGLFTVIYDVIGGIRAVVYSDVLQLIILVLILLLVLVNLVFDTGSLSLIFEKVDANRLQALDFSKHGFGDGGTFSFWPMLFGGFFLYVAYYGCDQSQVQRLLCAKDVEQTQRALLINGLLRFPLVALYCMIGIGISAYVVINPEFIDALPQVNDQPNYNLAVPLYIISELPVGVVGLGLVALFAAAMSSLDSVLNSLSASSMEDFLREFSKDSVKKSAFIDRYEIHISRALTVFWGSVCLALAFYVDDIAPTVLEAINKVGSLANGPILAVFTLGLLTRSASTICVNVALIFGILLNAYLWVFHPGISWLWWNVIGFFFTIVVAFTIALCLKGKIAYSANEKAIFNWKSHLKRSELLKSAALLSWFVALVLALSFTF